VADAQGNGGGRTKAWFWVLGSMIVVLAVVVVVLLVTRDDDNSSSAASSSTVATSTSAAPTTAAPTTTVPPTSTTVPYPVITDDPQTYAEYLLVAWQNGDRTNAANVASPDAVNQMFSQAYPAQGPYTLNNCSPGAGSDYCTWNGQNGATIQVTVRMITGGLPVQVEMVQFSS
jgi:hypothetical protein